MAGLINPSQRLSTTLVSLTTVQSALWRLGTPVIDAAAVANHKKRTKLGMLWQVIRGPILAIALLVAFECLGRSWGRAAVVAGAATLLATLFTWLVSAAELQWSSMSYSSYRSLYPVPAQVAGVAEALLQRGVAVEQVRVEYLKDDPILFAEDHEQNFGVQRYDLMIW